jgi:hypothetical protein
LCVTRRIIPVRGGLYDKWCSTIATARDVEYDDRKLG